MMYTQKMQKRLNFANASQIKNICFLSFTVKVYVFDGKKCIHIDLRIKSDFNETSNDI